MKTWKKILLKEWWNNNLDYLPLGARWRGLWQKKHVAIIIKELEDRKLDIEIAEKVFGYKLKVGEETEYHDYGGQTEYPQLQYLKQVYDDGSGEDWESLPYYSTDLKDAFLIVNKFAEDGFDCEVSLGRHIGHSENCYAHFYHGDSNSPWKPGTKMGQGWGSTNPLAICAAALEVKLISDT
jgi:hypothetical protein